MTTSRLAVLLLAGSLSISAWAENATLIRAADLKAKPFSDAATVTSLVQDSKVQILGNEGGWTQIRSSDGKTGWVRLLSVRPDSRGDTGGGVVKGIANLGNVARTGSTGTTATTGTKGISQDDLARANPNPQEVARLDQYVASPRDAEHQAKSQRLQARDVAYLQAADGQRP